MLGMASSMCKKTTICPVPQISTPGWMSTTALERMQPPGCLQRYLPLRPQALAVFLSIQCPSDTSDTRCLGVVSLL